jgi:hypothetical protein
MIRLATALCIPLVILVDFNPGHIQELTSSVDAADAFGGDGIPHILFCALLRPYSARGASAEVCRPIMSRHASNVGSHTVTSQ